jgi:hypothetical protein
MESVGVSVWHFTLCKIMYRINADARNLLRHTVQRNLISAQSEKQHSLAKHDRYNYIHLLETLWHSNSGNCGQWSMGTESKLKLLLCQESVFRHHLFISLQYKIVFLKTVISQARIKNVEKFPCSVAEVMRKYVILPLTITKLQCPTLLLSYSLDNLNNLIFSLSQIYS